MERETGFVRSAPLTFYRTRTYTSRSRGIASRDAAVRLERETGFEPATLSLGKRRGTKE
jgi:hypothetical protein